MNRTVIAGYIQDRINILKSEQVGLKLFIQSDQCRHEALQKAISELNWVLEKLEAE
ncbi:MAG: hypothetical protein M0R49_04525 [Limnochordia bacterium]|jgi:hypothetical protein|nr:hypothetical protein [Limnochordia bacterium]